MLPKVAQTKNSSMASDHYDVVLSHLRSAAAYFGIDWEQRVIIAERINKRLHIERHIAADLFLDSFVYGAHSTATDALRGVRYYTRLLSF